MQSYDVLGVSAHVRCASASSGHVQPIPLPQRALLLLSKGSGFPDMAQTGTGKRAAVPATPGDYALQAARHARSAARRSDAARHCDSSPFAGTVMLDIAEN